MSLGAADFADFVWEVHDQEAFPWQAALVESVLAEGHWPHLVDVPTGLGKTSLIDIAVFVAAATSHQSGPSRVGRRRCLFVVDRRTVVDDATLHAQRIAAALAKAESRDGDTMTAWVAAGLRRLGGNRNGPVLPVARMRGGTASRRWDERPDQPVVVVGTVDQVGSRLLFRRYGVAPGRRSIEAALIGTDALLLVDEAHLAEALVVTASAAGERDRMGVPIPGLDIVQLTATAHSEAIGPGRRFALDVAAHLAVPEAARRLTAAKRLTLRLTTARRAVATLAEEASALATSAVGGTAPAVLVVCNTIDTARAVHEMLGSRLAAGRCGAAGIDLDLLIGRSRPVDRGGLDQRIRARYGIGAARMDRPGILVATQTVEVGVNLDVDALVTESASWDALVQRLGRLNRLGHYQDRFPGAGAARAVVVHDGRSSGPVYGTARDTTWRHLTSLASGADGARRADELPTVPVSPLECCQLTAGVPADAYLKTGDVPILTAPILDQWAKTAPVPVPDPPVDPYLHGFDAGSPSCTVAWRTGLLVPTAASTSDVGPTEVDDAACHSLLSAAPVHAGEEVEVPLVALRAWVAGRRVGPVADIDDAAEDAVAPSSRDAFRVLAWRESVVGTGWRWVHSDELRPGDRVVVPVERGGLDRYGWHPEHDLVIDVSEAAAVDAGRLLLRLDHDLPQRLSLREDRAERVAALIGGLRAAEGAWGQSGRDAPTSDVSGESSQGEVDAQLRLLLHTMADAVSAAAIDTSEAIAHGWGSIRRTALQLMLQAASRSRPYAQIVTLADAGDPARLPDPDRPDPPLAMFVTWRPDPRSDHRGDYEPLPEVSLDGDAAPSLSRHHRVGLDQHQRNVRDRAIAIAEHLGLPSDLIGALGDAAGWHDIGKVETRFQAMLHHGDVLDAMVAVEPLAKSGLDPQDRQAWRDARRQSALPTGVRHEAWSAALVAKYISSRAEPYPYDPDLTVHLVASHHGHARPLLPLVLYDDTRPVKTAIDGMCVQVRSSTTVDLDHPGRFARLNRRYGRWGLALLEAVVRSADTTVSAEGS